jgi:hypothetical protein
MVMLALLGDEWIINEPKFDASVDYGIIATKRENDQIAILSYHTSDDPLEKVEPITLGLNLKGIPFSDAAIIEYRIDTNFSNPYAIIHRTLDPDTLRDRAMLASVSEPVILDLALGNYDIDITLDNASVSLVVITAKKEPSFTTIDLVGVNEHLNHLGQKSFFIQWDEVEDRSLYEYEVVWRQQQGSEEIILSKEGLRISAFATQNSMLQGQGEIMVRALDFWNREIGRSQWAPSMNRN